MQNGAERQTILEAEAEVFDINILTINNDYMITINSWQNHTQSIIPNCIPRILPHVVLLCYLKHSHYVPAVLWCLWSPKNVKIENALL